MERRKTSTTAPSPLPVDYLHMVAEVFTTHFEAGLKLFAKYSPEPYFQGFGMVYSDEIVLAVSLMNRGQLAATTVYASVDFDPKASAPTVQDLLSVSVDAIGTVFGNLLSPEKPETMALLAHESLSVLENVPFDWTAVETENRQIFLKIDKANLAVDSMADAWLQQNDPSKIQDEEEKQKQTETLFFTGPKDRDRKSN